MEFILKQFAQQTVLSSTTHEFPYQNSKQRRNILYTECYTTIKTQINK